MNKILVEKRPNELFNFNVERDYDENYISWNSYYMAVAKLVSCRSKDPVTKVGACIVKDNRIISTGYNGFPRGIDDDKYPWTKDHEDPTENKFFYVVHAELNAILNAKCDVSDSTLYVTKFPCNECVKAIIQSGITKIFYINEDESYFDEPKHNIPKRMLEDVGIELIRFREKNHHIDIEV